MATALKKPTLDSVSTINEDGSKYFLHPADVSGRFSVARRLTGIILLAIYVLLPWININGHPAVFFDIANRRFHLFGLSLAAQDAWLLFFVISGAAFSLFFVTALLGRIWCGWACPYTVFLEHVFRRVERWIDGPAVARRALDSAPWGFGKIVKRVVKHSIYLVLAAAIAHIFLSYFVSLSGLYGYMKESPANHIAAFAMVVVLTGILYFCFSWFREQFCIVLCPYGRLQSVLTDDDSLVIGYDKLRGEPRGKATDASAGACIDCRRCVQVCPTGIDIRNGLQMECIGCAACVDACDEVMLKLDRPTGLVRYDSLNGLSRKKRRILRPRIVLYAFLLSLGMGAAALALTRVHGFEMSVSRLPGLPYSASPEGVRNQFGIRLVSKGDGAESYVLSASGLPPQAVVSGMEASVTVPPQGELRQSVVILLPAADYHGHFRFTFEAKAQKTGEVVRREFEFVGPDARFYREAVLEKQPAK